jgi:hypothetical protein
VLPVTLFSEEFEDIAPNVIIIIIIIIIIITIPNNKPDFIILDNEKKTCTLIDAAISGDRNMI